MLDTEQNAEEIKNSPGDQYVEAIQLPPLFQRKMGGSITCAFTDLKGFNMEQV